MKKNQQWKISRSCSTHNSVQNTPEKKNYSKLKTMKGMCSLFFEMDPLLPVFCS